MSTQQAPAWLGHATQVSIAAGIPGIYRLREEADRIAARLRRSGAKVAVHHFQPDNYAVITVGTEARNAPAVQAQIDDAIAKAGSAS